MRSAAQTPVASTLMMAPPSRTGSGIVLVAEVVGPHERRRPSRSAPRSVPLQRPSCRGRNGWPRPRRRRRPPRHRTCRATSGPVADLIKGGHERGEVVVPSWWQVRLDGTGGVAEMHVHESVSDELHHDGQVLAGPERVAGVEQHADPGRSTASQSRIAASALASISAACTPRPAPCPGRRRARRSTGTRPPSSATACAARVRTPESVRPRPQPRKRQPNARDAIRRGLHGACSTASPARRVLPKATARPARGRHRVEDCADRQLVTRCERQVRRHELVGELLGGVIDAQLDAIEAEAVGSRPRSTRPSAASGQCSSQRSTGADHDTVPSAGHDPRLCGRHVGVRGDCPDSNHEAGRPVNWSGFPAPAPRRARASRGTSPARWPRRWVFSPSPTSMASWRKTRTPTAASGCRCASVSRPSGDSNALPDRASHVVLGAEEARHGLAGGLLVEVPWQAVLLDAARQHQRDAVGQHDRLLLVVCDEHARDAQLSLDLADEVPHLDAQIRVQLARAARRAAGCPAR